MSNHGAIFQKDLGPTSLEVARRIVVFDPDASWVPVTPDEEAEAERARAD